MDSGQSTLIVAIGHSSLNMIMEQLWALNNEGRHEDVLIELQSLKYKEHLTSALLSQSEAEQTSGVSLGMVALNSSLHQENFEIVRQVITVLQSIPATKGQLELEVHACKMLTAFLSGRSYEGLKDEELLELSDIKLKLPR